ncbi:agmatinase [Myxococcota bacterium]|nr:agmatinase [Myxococcota bacterium]
MSTELYSGHFLGLEPEFHDYARARVVVLPLPYEGTVSYGTGTSRGPAAIIAASQQVEGWDEELDRETWRVGIATAEPVPPHRGSSLEEIERIAERAREIVADDKFVVGLGGEHTVSLGLIRALKERHPGLSVLQIDAHLDLRDEYDGTAHSHATVMRRVRELGCKIVCCGARAFDREEWEYARAQDIRVFRARELGQSTAFVEDAVAALEDPVFVTVDLDGFDPSVAPSTGTPEPGGLGYAQVLELLRVVGERKRVVGCDVVELAPDGVNHHSDLLAARVAYKMMGYFVDPR